MKVKRKNLMAAFGTVLAAVHGNENRHGDKRKFPEPVVDHQVQGDEDAEHGRLLNKEEQVENFAPFLDRVPTGQNADGCEQANQHHQP